MRTHHLSYWLHLFYVILLVPALLPAQVPYSSGDDPALTKVEPAVVGMSSQRLARLDSLVQAAVDEAYLPGAVILVGRKGHVPYIKAFGYRQVGEKDMMDTDDLFRIASMTKPIVSVGIMMLYEEGRFLLDDPISDWAPEFAKMQLLEQPEASSGDGKANNTDAKPITFRHLLSHTSGIGYPFMNQSLQPIAREKNLIEGASLEPVTLAENMQRLSQMPLLHQPGERWTYGMSTDVLGYLIERIAGQPLDVFLHERIFEPLGMSDTHFYIPEADAPRLAQLYYHAPDGSYQPNPDPRMNFPHNGARTYFSGGAGLTSTAMDYAKFLQMLLNGGHYNGHSILGRKTIELMTTDHLHDLPGGPAAFGLGFAIATPRDAARRLGSVGTYRWSGIFGTDFWVDPREELFAVIMTQVLPFRDKQAFFEKIQNVVYQSLIAE